MGSDRTKLIIYILVGLLLLGLLGVGIYWYMGRGSSAPGGGDIAGGNLPAPENVSGTQGNASGTPPSFPLNPGSQEAPAGSSAQAVLLEPRQLTSFPVISPTLSADENKVLYYKKDGGDLYSYDFSTNTQDKISNITILGLVDAVWAPKKDKAAVFYLDNETLKGFIHSGSSSVVMLPLDVKGFAWSPDGNSFAYLLPREGKLSLVISDTGKTQKTVYQTLIMDARIKWISTDTIIFETAPSGLAPGYAFAYSRKNNAFAQVLGPHFGLTTLWSPDATRVLYGFTDSAGKNPTLSVADNTGKDIYSSTLHTLPEKCAFASIQDIYCAVPASFSQGVWPDEYLRGEINTSDGIMALNLQYQSINEVFTKGGFDASNIAVTKNKNWFFFVNRRDGTLWSIKLK